MSNVLDNLEQQLERSIENIRQIQIIVSDFQPQGQPVLNQVCCHSPFFILRLIYAGDLNSAISCQRFQMSGFTDKVSTYLDSEIETGYF